MERKLTIQKKLHFGDVDIVLRSRHPQTLSEDEKRGTSIIYPKSFFFNKKQKPDIVIDVEIVDTLPRIRMARRLFSSHNPQSTREWWMLGKGDGSYQYRSHLLGRHQAAIMHRDFSYATLYFSPRRDKLPPWNWADTLYNFLEIMLMHYLALHKKGIYVHASAVSDGPRGGLLFAGKSGAGKSTIARLWYGVDPKQVLNDDRMLLTKRNGAFCIHSTLWNGEFNEYLKLHLKPAPLRRLFILYHDSGNVAKRIPAFAALAQLIPAVFLPFWEKELFENTISFCQEVVSRTPCYELGFMKSEAVVNYIKHLQK